MTVTRREREKKMLIPLVPCGSVVAFYAKSIDFATCGFVGECIRARAALACESAWVDLWPRNDSRLLHTPRLSLNSIQRNTHSLYRSLTHG